MQCWHKRTHRERKTRVNCEGTWASREQMCVRERRTNRTLPLLVQVMVSVKSWLIWVLSRSQHGWAHKQNATGSAGTSSVSGRNIPPLLHELIKPSLALALSLSPSRDYPSVLYATLSFGCSGWKCPCTFFSDSLFTERSVVALHTLSLINSAISKCFS